MSNEESTAAPTGAPVTNGGQDAGNRRASFTSQNSQTAKEFIESQMRLEADAREVLPYSFDSCTQNLGPLRQTLFACLTCNPPPSTPDAPFTAAGVCYSCSIVCHGEHTLVELFTKRNFVCDCGTTRIATSPCTLRNDPKTGAKGVQGEEPHAGNHYNANFKNRFCGCGEDYNAHEEKGTMFQCLGLGTVETGGCGEDWWHPECLISLPRDWYKTSKKNVGTENGVSNEQEEEDETPLPPGFPAEDDFETFLCYKCIDSNPWLKKYADTPGFLAPLFRDGGLQQPLKEENTSAPEASSTIPEPQPSENTKKRKAEEPPEDDPTTETTSKRYKEEPQETTALPEPEITPKTEPEAKQQQDQKPKHTNLPSSAPLASFSLFLKEDFRDHLCRCPTCYPNLASHPQLREEEETYEPPLSENGDADGANSTGTGSLLDRGEAALSNIDRVRAIEGAMVYNHLRDKVKEFLKPFAESGTAVGADDIKAYFEKLRGDEQGIRDAAGKVEKEGGGGDDEGGDGRKEQSGY
ncbi:putative metaphase-anaphase transition protein [Aspergillus karnatakaensis]|uniref:putative metaphase-anaphase transition protein (Mlo2) n=1 Tax=Aspergillus karnatakaensis TaxID=1810916 RepID=UPI003CCE2FB3